MFSIGVIVHWGLEMGGEGCLACLVFGCRNGSHRHGRIVRFISGHAWARWSLNGLATYGMALITVHLVG